MNKIRRLLDTKKLQEKQKQEEDRLMNIGIKKNVVKEDPFGPVEIDIERIQASIDSGFVRIPSNLSEDEILDFLLK